MVSSAKTNLKVNFTIGLIAPIFYFAFMETLGTLWEGYSPIRHHMSELGGVESPYKTIMNVFGFAGLGVALGIFGLGMGAKFQKNFWLKTSAFLLFIAGIFMILTGMFPCDAGCIDVTTIGKLHTLASIPPSILLPVAALLSGIGFGSEKAWGRKWMILSILLGAASLLMGPLLSLPALYPFVGLVQRLGIGLSLLWMMIVSAKMLTILQKK